jgi:hypothetical protein
MSFIVRFARCRFALGALLVVAGSLLLGGCGSGGGRVYRDKASGLQLNYPVGFRALSYFAYNGPELGGSGLIVVNKVGRAVLSPGSSAGLFVWADLKPNAVVFTLRSGRRIQDTRNYGGTLIAATPGLPAVGGVSTDLPLRSTLFRSLKEEEIPNGVYWRALGFETESRVFAADVYIGPRASKADRAAIWRVVSSLRLSS